MPIRYRQRQHRAQQRYQIEQDEQRRMAGGRALPRHSPQCASAAAGSDATVSRIAWAPRCAPSARDRRQRDHREGQAIKRLRQAGYALPPDRRVRIWPSGCLSGGPEQFAQIALAGLRRSVLLRAGELVQIEHIALEFQYRKLRPALRRSARPCRRT